jgi:hypothetical protein
MVLLAADYHSRAMDLAQTGKWSGNGEKSFHLPKTRRWADPSSHLAECAFQETVIRTRRMHILNVGVLDVLLKTTLLNRRDCILDKDFHVREHATTRRAQKRQSVHALSSNLHHFKGNLATQRKASETKPLRSSLPTIAGMNTLAYSSRASRNKRAVRAPPECPPRNTFECQETVSTLLSCGDTIMAREHDQPRGGRMAWLTIRQVFVLALLVLFCAIALNHSAWENWYRVLFRPLFLVVVVLGLGYILWRK